MMRMRMLFTISIVIITVFPFAYHLLQLKQFNHKRESVASTKESYEQIALHQEAATAELRNRQNSSEPGFNCINASIEGLRFPICGHGVEKDVCISKVLYSGGFYENELATKFIDLFKRHTNVTFVDLGAHLGLYSLPVAHLGGHVVAVEPNPDTYRRLTKSIDLGGVSSRIEAVNCALTDVDKSTTVLATVPTITLERLLPLIRNDKVVIKADVQGNKMKIFSDTSAAVFFKTVEVPIVLIEWDQYSNNYAKLKSTRLMVYKFLEFFRIRGYEVYDPKSENKLPVDWTKWSPEVVFKKRCLPTRKLFSF